MPLHDFSKFFGTSMIKKIAEKCKRPAEKEDDFDIGCIQKPRHWRSAIGQGPFTLLSFRAVHGHVEC